VSGPAAELPTELPSVTAARRPQLATRLFERHSLQPALLTNARFRNAILTNTILRGVDLRTVSGLTPAQLEAAITDENTLPPLNWGGGDAADSESA
jgi:uncharacterized protein YjbI with pentapeptide repeats